MSNATLPEQLRPLVHQEVTTPGSLRQRRFSMARRVKGLTALTRLRLIGLPWFLSSLWASSSTISTGNWGKLGVSVQK